MIGTHAYLKSGWNVMDGFLVFIALVDLSIALTASSSPRIFGILRVFRLLRCEQIFCWSFFLGRCVVSRQLRQKL